MAIFFHYGHPSPLSFWIYPWCLHFNNSFPAMPLVEMIVEIYGFPIFIGPISLIILYFFNIYCRNFRKNIWSNHIHLRKWGKTYFERRYIYIILSVIKCMLSRKLNTLITYMTLLRNFRFKYSNNALYPRMCCFFL